MTMATLPIWNNTNSNEPITRILGPKRASKYSYADQQDNLALSILNQWSDSIAEGIAQIQIIYDPGLILIGGGVSSQGQNLLKYIVPKVEHYLPEQYGHAHIQTTRTQNHAALYGAVSKF